MALSITSREQFEVYKFSLPVSIGVPVLAVLIQSMFFHGRLGFMSVLDLPLLVLIFFAVARRNPMLGVMTGALIGLFQDSLTHNYVGLFGISKTLVGYLSSSLGVKVDVENPGSRLLMTIGFYFLQQCVYLAILRFMADKIVEFNVLRILFGGLANGLLAVVIFAMLDRLKRRT